MNVEYRGQRSAAAFLAFLEAELQDLVTIINSTEDIKQVSRPSSTGTPRVIGFEKCFRMVPVRTELEQVELEKPERWSRD